MCASLTDVWYEAESMWYKPRVKWVAAPARAPGISLLKAVHLVDPMQVSLKW